MVNSFSKKKKIGADFFVFGGNITVQVCFSFFFLSFSSSLR